MRNDLMVETPSAPRAGEIIQVAYHVADIRASMERFTALLGIGPWFLLEHAIPAGGARYRSQPTDVDIHAAFGFAGPMQYELIQQVNDVPSVYRAHQAAHGYGFHHWGSASMHFDEEVAAHRRQGRDPEFLIRSATTRLAYIDLTPAVPGWLELIEWTPAFTRGYFAMRDAARDWDGRDPVRSRASLA
jgi:hypothetical protein